MALSSAVAASIYLSALGHVRGDPSNADAAAIARTIRGRFPPDRRPGFFDTINIVRTAIRAVRAGGQLESDPSRPLAPGDHPKVPSTAVNQGSYEYRIVIVADPGDGTDPFRTGVTVSSPVPLSEADLARIAQQIYDSQNFERDYRNEVGRVGPGAGVSVVVVSAGRTS